VPTPTVVRVWIDQKARNQGKTTVGTLGLQTRYKVQFDGFATQKDALTATGIPQAGTILNGDPVTGAQATQTDESPFVWDVLVDTASPQPQPGDKNSITVRKGVASREISTLQDRLNLPLVNVVGDLLPTIPTVTLGDATWHINWSSTNLASWATGSNVGSIEFHTNSDPVDVHICGFNIAFAKSQGKIMQADVDCTKTLTNPASGTVAATYKFNYSHSLTIQVRKPKWYWKQPNEGWRGYFGGMTNVAQFNDAPAGVTNTAGYNPRTAPTKLDIDGFELAHTDNPLFLPDDLWATSGTPPNGSRAYAQDGAFELEPQTTFSSLFIGLTD
jgi:hypothetical protein